MAERALVCGAGVAGLTCALALADEGFGVTLIAPDEATTASTVAAGMLAPTAEHLLDLLSPPLALMSGALAAWPAFAARLGVAAAFHRCGTLFLGDGPTSTRTVETAGAMSAADARRLIPGLVIDGDVGFAPDDARIDVDAVHAALLRACAEAGVNRVVDEVRRASATRVITRQGLSLDAQEVVIAAGWRSADLGPGPAPQPIRGQLLRFEPNASIKAGSPMVRGHDGYLCLTPDGVIAGATMEFGVSDTTLDTDTAESQARFARALLPALRDTPSRARVGVRAGTADGLPLVGRTADGMLLCTGFRRNGWLLAPMAAQAIAALAAGRPTTAWAAGLEPSRF